MKVPSSLSCSLLGATVLALVQTQPVAALSATQINAIARQITVLIDGQNPGSGVMIKREGNRFTVLTARHVVATPDEYELITPDGKRTRLNYNTVKPLPGVDLAILEFTSPANYTIAKLGNARRAPGGTTVYVAGFPAPTAAITQSIFTFTEGKITANAERPLADGYALVYSNNTLPGMSGGPVLNGVGEVIGIHGKADTERSGTQTTTNPNVVVKTGFNLAIPINTFLSLASRTALKGFPVPVAAPLSNQPTADNFFLQAIAKYRQQDYRGAVADFNQAIRLNPQLDLAYYNRGLARYGLQDYRGAVADFDQAIRLNPQDADAYNNRGSVRRELQDYRGAIADFDQAIRLNPKFDLAYYNRGIARRKLQDYGGALADFDQAIRLNPRDADAYNNRGTMRYGLQDYRGAIADFDQAIRLNPEDADVYNNRGFVRYGLQDYRGAIADFDQAIRLQPDLALAYYHRGLARAQAEERRAALPDYQRAAELAQTQGNDQVYQLAIMQLREIQP